MKPDVSGNPITRCPWSENDPLLTRYHDEEWGVPVHDDRKHFEFLVLEVNQAGLSWKTVLAKRERYREVYDGFDPVAAAGYGDEKIALLLNDPGIIRNRKKIEASIENARRFLQVQKEFASFDNFLWGFVGGRPVVNSWRDQSDIPPRTELSDKVSAELRARGFKFAGSTIVYAHLQAVGVVNDHIAGCFRYRQLTGR
jgi:DNA-3-methyladenine glycosylase I